MLSARKLHLVAGLKVGGVELRNAELNFYMMRYVSVAGFSSLLTGLSYVGIIKIKIPEHLRPPDNTSWQVFMFYVSLATTMALALFNLAVTSFLVVNAQGLMLRGPPNSVARCVAILSGNWFLVRSVLALSLLALFTSTVAIAWMKLDDVEGYPYNGIASSAVVVVAVAAAIGKMFELARQLRISDGTLVHGDLSVYDPAGQQEERIDILSEEREVIPVARS